MLTFSLNTFIKVCLLDTGGRISEIQRKLSGTGGYDFYKPLHKAVRAYASEDLQAVEDILDAPVNSAERQRNREAFEGFRTKFGSIKSIEPVSHPKPVKFPSAGIAISVDPVFEVTKAGVRQVYCLWPTQKPELTQRYGAVACHLMRRAFANDPLGNAGFFYADTVRGKVYSEKQVTNNTNLILMADVNSIGTLVKEL